MRRLRVHSNWSSGLVLLSALIQSTDVIIAAGNSLVGNSLILIAMYRASVVVRGPRVSLNRMLTLLNYDIGARSRKRELGWVRDDASPFPLLSVVLL